MQTIIDRPTWAVNNELTWAVAPDPERDDHDVEQGDDQAEDRPGQPWADC
jgi:hypothetical protein